MKRIVKVQKKGFTLLEVMLVVAILCILAGLGFISVTDGINRGQAVQSRDEDKFATQVQSATDYIRHSMLSVAPVYST